jgi:thiol-disulfide isomerase/thioredoxin
VAIDLTRAHAVILVFVMDGCGACEEYLPRFTAQVDQLAKAGTPVGFLTEGAAPEGSVAVLVYDAASPERAVQDIANRYAVAGTPSTITLRRGVGASKVEGGVTDSQIRHLLIQAAA